ncbi:ribonuclease H-like domain-containing protein [Tanacetum coccineum]
MWFSRLARHNQSGTFGSARTMVLTRETLLPSAFSTITIRDPTWNMDTGASSHLKSHSSNLSIVYNNRLYPSVCVGDEKTIPTLSRPLYLHNVLATPNIIKNLISVRQFTRDNKCSVEFDEFGFSVKDFLTHHILLRCDSLGDIYPVTKPSPIPSALLSISPSRWHQHLEHPDVALLNRGVANVVAKTAWLRNLLKELHTPLLSTTLVYCDNVSAIYMTTNPVQHQRTKHIEIDIYFVHDMVARGQIRVLHLPSHYQYADIFTKGLSSALFEEFRTSLSVRPSPAQTAGAYSSIHFSY